MFRKYRLCLILSGMAVVLVCSSLLFLKKGDEQSVGYSAEMETEGSGNLLETDLEADSEFMMEESVTEENSQPENVSVSEYAAEESPVLDNSPGEEETLAEKKEEVSKLQPDFAPETQPEAYPEDDPAETPEPEPVLTPLPTTNPEPDPTPDPVPEEPAVETPKPVVHEHNWLFESWYQEPTCSNGGLAMEICAHCGETQVTGGTPTEQHSYEVETPGDCLSEEVVVCSMCNYREVREKKPGNHIDVEEGFCYGCGKNTD